MKNSFYSPCVVYHTAPGFPNLQILLGVNPDLVRFECVCTDAWSAFRKCQELSDKYAPLPKHMSGYHYCSGKDWCDYWLSQRTSGYQLSLI